MTPNDLLNGFMILDGKNAQPLPKDLFEIPYNNEELSLVDDMVKFIGEGIDNEILRILQTK